jgi:hypothetical protein
MSGCPIFFLALRVSFLQSSLLHAKAAVSCQKTVDQKPLTRLGLTGSLTYKIQADLPTFTAARLY